MYKYRAIVRSVYDADTIRVDIDLGFGITSKGSDGKGEALRLYGINAPEVRGAEKEEGKRSRDYVRDLLPEGKEIIIQTIRDKKGKYGRYLAIVWLSNEEAENPFIFSLNKQLVELGYAAEKEY